MGLVLILGTGGTIAGTASDPDRPWAYEAGQLSVSSLVGAVPGLAQTPLATEQVAQVDSKDMGWPIWQALGRAIRAALAREEVSAIVVAHGTDTLEETALLLHALHAGEKPIVLTAAMRPATSPEADGPANLLWAVQVAASAAARGEGGVAVALAGRIWSARDVRKAHTHAVDAFDGGGAQPLGERSSWPAPEAQGWQLLEAASPPRVELVSSHADADGWLVDAALAHAAATHQRLEGLVVACTGHGTWHRGLEAALSRARDAGVTVWRSSRVARGGVLARPDDVWPAAGEGTPAQARVRLMLHLLSGPR